MPVIALPTAGCAWKTVPTLARLIDPRRSRGLCRVSAALDDHAGKTRPGQVARPQVAAAETIDRVLPALIGWLVLEKKRRPGAACPMALIRAWGRWIVGKWADNWRARLKHDTRD